MNKTLQEQYNLIKEGKGNKQQFFKSARHTFPDLVTSVNTFEDTVRILKNRGIISEGIGGVVTKGKTPDWHSIFKENMNSMDYGSWKKELINIIKKDANLDDNEIAVDEEEIKRYYKEGKSPSEVYNNVWLKDAGNFRSISFESLNKKDDDDDAKYDEMIKRYEDEKDAKYTLPNIGNLREAKEAKVIEKEPTKDVVDMETKGYNYKDKKNYDNVFGQEFLQGFYTEMQDPKNEDKTVDELRAIVAKNLSKDINHYIKDGQFGLKGVGYQTEAPGLGTPKEAKGKHKSSGYGDLKESVLRSQIYLLIKEVLFENVHKPTEEEKNLNALKEKALKQAGEAIMSTGTNTHKVVFNHNGKTVAIAFRDSKEKANSVAKKLKKTGLLTNVKVTLNK
jgi:hypothetical protein